MVAEGAPTPLSDALRALASEQRASFPADVVAEMDRETAALVATGAAGRAAKAGEPAPDFALPNVRGDEIRLGDLLGRAAVVLAFYRGAW